MDQNHCNNLNTNVIEKDVLDLFTPALQSPDLPVLQSSEDSKEIQPPEVVERECLSSKNAVKFLLNGTLKKKVCRYCLNVTSPLSELDQVLQVAGQGVFYKITIREMIASFHSSKVVDDPNFPNKICNKCLDHTLTSYLFNQQCERSERALRNCFEDMYEKLEKLDPLERTKRRGRQKLNLNHNVLYADYEKVIDYAEPLITIVNTSTEQTGQKSDKQESKAFICLKCCQELPNLESLLNHEKSHPKSMCYHCHLCGKSFVKRYHLKKHSQTAHAPSKQLDMQTTDFKCQECGTVTPDYQAHLQHIEKHKFKTVLDHLMTRKMDKLCSICLNPGSKLVDLEKVVCLHGGYPEIMGDHTLYNIVGSTVPAKSSSYKYQELHVPSEAKVLSIVKIFKTKEDTKKHRFIMSPPVVISKDIMSCKSTYVYIFESPDFLQFNTVHVSDGNAEAKLIISDDKDNTFETVVIDEDDNMDVKFNIIKASNKELNSSDKDLAFVDKPVLTFTKVSQYTDIKEDAKNTSCDYQTVLKNTKRPSTSCKTCWIFKKPTCEMCLGANFVLNTKFQDQDCQSCWFFKSCKQCSFCKKPMTNDVECNTETDLEHYLDIDAYKQSSLKATKRKYTIRAPEQNYDKETSYNIGTEDKDSNSIVKKRKIFQNTDQGMLKKRKLSDNILMKSKKSKWQCQICLTNNAHRELCLCCDSPQTLKEIKYNFKFNKDFFNTLNNNTEECNEEFFKVTYDPHIDKSALGNTIINNKGDLVQEKPQINIVDVKNQITNENNSVNTQAFKNIAYNCYVDHENVITKLATSEDMDIGDETPQVEQSMMNISPTPEMQPMFSNTFAQLAQLQQSSQFPQFQFHLGSAMTACKFSRKKRITRRF